MQNTRGSLALIERFRTEAFNFISLGLDKDGEGDYEQAISYYLQGLDLLRQALAQSVSPEEWGERAKGLNASLREHYAITDQRVKELREKLSSSGRKGKEKGGGKKSGGDTAKPRGWSSILSFSNAFNPIINRDAKAPVTKTRDLGHSFIPKPDYSNPPVAPGRSAPKSPRTTTSTAPAFSSAASIPQQLKGIDNAMKDAILNEIVDGGAGVSWDDIAGLEDAKSSLNEMVILPFLRPDIFHGLREPPRGVLLFGPPGTGKTMLAKAVATESKSTFFSTKASTLVNKYMGEGEKMVKTLFGIALHLAPSIVFIDEIDSLLSARSDSEHEGTRRLKNEFLIQIDGLSTVTEQTQKRILVMGATNRPQDLDEAALRRLTRRIYIPLPNIEARVFLINMMLKKQKSSVSKRDVSKIAQMCDGYSASDIVEIVREAALFPVRELGSRIRDVPASAVRSIQVQDLSTALTRVRPSVSKTSLHKMEKWNKEFGVA